MFECLNSQHVACDAMSVCLRTVVSRGPALPLVATIVDRSGLCLRMLKLRMREREPITVRSVSRLYLFRSTCRLGASFDDVLASMALDGQALYCPFTPCSRVCGRCFGHTCDMHMSVCTCSPVHVIGPSMLPRNRL